MTGPPQGHQRSSAAEASRAFRFRHEADLHYESGHCARSRFAADGGDLFDHLREPGHVPSRPWRARWRSHAGLRWAGSGAPAGCRWRHRWPHAGSWRGRGLRAKQRAWRRAGPTPPAGAWFAAGAILPGPAPMLGGPPQGPAQPADGRPTERQPFDLLQLLRGVAVIEVPVRRRQELAYSLSEPRG